jgi:hypothetical protein
VFLLSFGIGSLSRDLAGLVCSRRNVNSVYLLDISLTSKNIGEKTGSSAQEILQMMELSVWIKTVPV